MATPEAVQRRRENRRSRAAQRRRSAEEWDKWDRELGDRMVRRYFSPALYPDGVPLIFLDYRYWQARRCGWDALDDLIAVDLYMRPCSPMESHTWHWWTHLHYTQRGMFVRMSKRQRFRRR